MEGKSISFVSMNEKSLNKLAFKRFTKDKLAISSLALIFTYFIVRFRVSSNPVVHYTQQNTCQLFYEFPYWKPPKISHLHCVEKDVAWYFTDRYKKTARQETARFSIKSLFLFLLGALLNPALDEVSNRLGNAVALGWHAVIIIIR